MSGNQKKMDHGASTISRLVLSYISMIIILSFCYARDVIEHDTPIRDNGETLVSAGGRFELGFFTPNGSSDRRRYVGIWYTFSPLTVVWVANRDNALVNSTGVFAVQDGNVQVLDGSTGNSLWSTGLEISRSSKRTMKLMDSGNLVLTEGTEHGESLWESFKIPTDTFLPHMEMDTNLILKSWRKEDDPGIGGFTFKQDDREGENQFITMNKSMPYWKSGGKFSSSDKMPDSIVYMLSKFKSITNTYDNLTGPRNMDYNGTRLKISFDGYIQYYNWDKSKKAWDLKWSEPRDQCSIFNFCGKFGSCSADRSNSLACKCLPGFEPSYSEQWKSGDFSGGCNRAASCSDDDKFLSFKMINVGKTGSSDSQVNDTECTKQCLEECTCMAYSFRAAENNTLRRGDSSTSTSSCTIWLQELHDLQEGYADVGHSLVVYVRLASSDLGSTVRNCAPCGTTLIPYPLSTGPNCGDPMYSSFKCDNSTGRVTFKAITGDYPVISIDPQMRKFIIEVQNVNNCDSSNSSGKILQLNQSLPFNVNTNCSPEMRNISSQISSRSRNEVEIGWELPQEPTCTSDADCKEWPNSNCSYATTDGKKRCLCNTNFKWDGQRLNCSHVQEGTIHQPPEESPRKRTSAALIAVSIVASTVAALACSFISFIIWRRKMSKKQDDRRSDQRSKELLRLDTQRRIKHLMNSGEFEEEHEENIDVPFFDFESIIAATDDFSDGNKLGKGGYGPVYKGKFPGGQEIAVKRLSSVSGQGLQEFKNEVVLIAKLQHRNLVRLRGYCMRGEEKILLYEYMPNKSLDSFIFDETKSVLLDWEMRFNIILGIARGLLYLHQDSRLRIIHRDLKTSNILLDQDMEPKISDFGLARIVGGKQTEANTSRVVGTYGYMSPEYALEGLFSVKSDVFSFGVVLLEILSGKRNTRLVQESKPPLTLLGYAWRLWTENKVLDLMDPTLHGSCKEDQYLKCFKVGLLCVQEDPSERPTMSSVVTMLDSESSTVPTPQQPAFVLRKGSVVASSSSSKPETIAEMTVTLEEGR